jgi:hypothetical protein
MTKTSISKLASIACLLALSACASDTKSRVGTVATTPFSDLNIVRADIPEVLAEAQHHPYLAPANNDCDAIAIEIRKLDEVLGADLDTPASDNKPSLLDRSSEIAEDQAIGAMQRTAEGLIPFRGWVRKLSGAERYSKKVSASITAGSIRRAFLKGIASSQNCAPRPAVPATAVASAQ